MIGHDSVITAMIGSALGLPFGLFLALGHHAGLGRPGPEVVAPVRSLIAFGDVACLVGIVAPTALARRRCDWTCSPRCSTS